MPVPHRSCRLWPALLVAFGLGATGAPSSAAAQAAGDDTPTAAELARARTQFAKARKLEDAGKWSEALELFQRVAEVKTTPQVRFHIALCLEHVGLWTQALDGYAQAKREAEEQGVREVVREADERMSSLQRRIPTVTVVTPGAKPGDELTLDGRPIPQGDPPVPIRVDPGAHTAELRRGDELVAREVFVVKRGVTRVELDATRGSDAASGRPASSPSSTAGPREASSAQASAGWLLVGAGAVSATLSFVFLGFRQSKLHDVEQVCPDLRCDAARREEVDPLVEDGEGFATGVNVTVVVAGVLAAGGVALVLTAPDGEGRPDAEGAGSMGMRLTPAGPGLLLEGWY